MAENIVTDLVLNLGPFESQIDKAVDGMQRYDDATVDATKDTKTFENTLGSATGKLNATKVATDAVAIAEEKQSAALASSTKKANASAQANQALTGTLNQQATSANAAADATKKVATETNNTANASKNVSGVSGIWDRVKTSVAGAGKNVTDFFKGARDGTKQAIGEVGGLRGVFSQLGAGVKSTFSSIGSAFGSIGNTVKGLIPQVGGLGGSLLGLLGPAGIAAGAIAGIGGAFISNTDAGATFFDGVSRSAGIVFDKLTGVFKRVTGAIGDVFDALTDGETTIGKVFGFFTDVVTGLIAPFTDLVSLVGELTGISDALADAAIEGQALAQAYDEIEEAQTANIKKNAELEAQIKKLEVQLRNRTSSEEERLAIGEEIGRLEEERAANELAVLQKVTAAKRKEAENELKNKFEVSDETKKALAEAEAAEINASSESVVREERTQNRIDQIRKQGDDKRRAAAEKAAAEAKKIAEGRLAVEQDLAKAEAELLGERAKAEHAALATRDARVEKAAGEATLLVQIEEQYQADLQAIRDKAAADAEAVANKQAQALQNAVLSSTQDRLSRLREEQDVELQLAQQAGEDVTALLQKQFDDRASLEQQIKDIRLEQLELQYEEEFAALDGNLIAQYDREAQYQLDRATLLNESAVSELEAKRELIEQTNELGRAEEELARSRIDAVASAGQIITQLAGESKAAAILGFAAQKAAAIAQVVTTTNSAIAAAQAAAAAVPPILPPGIPNPAFAIAQGISVAQIARLKVGAAINLAQILAQSVSGFDKGGVVDSKGGRVKRADGVRIPTRPGGDNMLAFVQEGELYLNKKQRAKAEAAHPGIFGEIGVPGFSKPDIVSQQRYISTLGAVNSYVEGRTTNVTYNNTSTTATRFSDKKMVGAIGQSTREAKKQTELLAMMAKGARRGNKRYYA